MKPPRFAQETVTIVRDAPGGTDPYGDPIPGTTARIDVTRCLVVPNKSTEPTDRGRSGVITGWTVYAPAGTDARFTDQVEIPRGFHLVDGIEVPGTICRIDGEIGDWRTDPTGPGSVVINAVRAAG